MEVSVNGGAPLALEGLFHGKFIYKLWRYPYFGKHPNSEMVVLNGVSKPLTVSQESCSKILTWIELVHQMVKRQNNNVKWGTGACKSFGSLASTSKFQQLGLGLRLLAKRTRRRFAEHQINLGFYLFYLVRSSNPHSYGYSTPNRVAICAPTQGHLRPKKTIDEH